MNNIKTIREKRHISQNQLAIEMGLSQQAIAKWELNTSLPAADKLPKLAKILGCTIDELLRDPRDPEEVSKDVGQITK